MSHGDQPFQLKQFHIPPPSHRITSHQQPLHRNMSKFIVSSEVAELLPRMQVVVVIAKGLVNSGENPNTAAHVQSVVDKTVEYFTANK
ncbi:hypothetical protein TruAng_008509 [Truncatella angustata]|nr:hypothetical protein TruAng_008509 [Truncatella angustata]